MIVRTSRDFTCISASGKDWRDISRQVLSAFEKTDKTYSLGLLYATQDLCEDLGSILTLFQSVSQVEQWVANTAPSVFANGEIHANKPGLVCMLCKLDREDFCLFPRSEIGLGRTKEVLAPWLQENEALLGLIHSDISLKQDTAQILKELNNYTEAYLVGGLTSPAKDTTQLSDNIATDSCSGVLFSRSLKIITALSQGCLPIGEPHEVTKAEGPIVAELDKQKAFDVFKADLKAFAEAKSRRENSNGDSSGDPDCLLTEAEDFPQGELDSIAKGEIHVAFSVAGSDVKDYLVRNLAGVEPDHGWIVAASPVYEGDELLFVHRDRETIRSDLSRMLVDIRNRTTRDQGTFSPKAALYISCIGRTREGYGMSAEEEISLVEEILGPVPLIGFYARGEISNDRLYGYTGILTLFL